MGADAFWLERLPHAIMASFSAANQAAEIDFEDEAGQEMIDVLTRHLRGRNQRAGECLLRYREQSIACRIEVVQSKTSRRFRVSWTQADASSCPCGTSRAARGAPFVQGRNRSE